MSTLTSFSQAAQLQFQAVDDATRNGICVGLCDFWLSLIKRFPEMPPDQRLQQLCDNFEQPMNHQRNYAYLRRQYGRGPAREQVGRELGLNYDTENTMLLRVCLDMSSIRAKLAADIGCIGSGATWTLRFSDGTGHAIAGFCGVEGQEPIMRLTSHVFDPNIGEYAGLFPELDDMLFDLLSKFPLYQTIVEVNRTTES